MNDGAPRSGSDQITPRPVYEAWLRSRRRLLRDSVALLGVASVPVAALERDVDAAAIDGPAFLERAIAAVPGSARAEAPTPYEYASQYNNFYEFGTDKGDPAENARGFVTDPWSVEVAGEVERPGVYPLEAVLTGVPLEERVYRLRCVEAWSMVIPWIGVPLAAVLSRFAPTAAARFVEFTTLYDPQRMPEQRALFSAIDYPYVEGLRLDEAMHPLAILAVGMYGEVLPPQNGAPLRLVTPWKYGFKSIKSIVRINLTAEQPRTTWNAMAPHEYGFYANVNPDVDHPRWSQRTERRLPGTLFSRNVIDTQPFNGYAAEVASLYSGLDLRRNF